MKDSSGEPSRPGGAESHARWVRISHWIITLSVLTLVFSGFEILMVHPRLYWGNAGNDLTPALIELPISRNYKHNGYTERVPLTDDASGPVSANRTYFQVNRTAHPNEWERVRQTMSLAVRLNERLIKGSIDGAESLVILNRGKEIPVRLTLYVTQAQA